MLSENFEKFMGQLFDWKGKDPIFFKVESISFSGNCQDHFQNIF